MRMNNILESVIRKILQKGRWIRFHHLINAEAESLLKNIESEKGKINQKLKKLAKEYACDVLGWAGYAPWLNVYSAMAGEFKEGWMPDNYYGWIVVPKMKGFYGEIAKINPLAAKLLNTNRLPNIAYYVNGLFFSPTWEVLTPETVEKYIFKDDSRIVYKTDDSSQGQGVHFLTKGTFNVEKIQLMEWNGTYNDIKFSEATQGPCFADLGWERLWKE